MDVLQRAGRRVRLGMIGGGLDSVIGSTHLVALRADGLADLTAGAMSVDPDIARTSADAVLIPRDRQYDSWQEMLESEAARTDGVDAVVVITPPQFHGEISEAFLRAGIAVLCEKPMTADLAQARSLAATVASSGSLFGLTHCYTGYPLVREMRALVQGGALGRITMVDGEFAAGDPGVLREPDDPNRRHWHFRPEVMGKGVVLGEVGSHVHHLAEFVTGQQVRRVHASLTTIAERREVYDNAYLDVEFDGGAVGRLWASFVAAGHDHGLRIRIFGDEGSLHWDQEHPEHLLLRRPGEPSVNIARGLDTTSAAARSATRVRPGHPEGYLMAFATLYREFLSAVLARIAGEDPEPHLELLPSVAEGMRTIELIEAAVRSAEAGTALDLAG